MKTQDLRISKNLKNKIRKTSLSFEQAALTFCLLILVADYTLEPLSIGQVSFRSYLQSKKIYLSRTGCYLSTVPGMLWQFLFSLFHSDRSESVGKKLPYTGYHDIHVDQCLNQQPSGLEVDNSKT